MTFSQLYSNNDNCVGAVLKNMPKLQELSLSGNGFTKLDSLGKILKRF